MPLLYVCLSSFSFSPKQQERKQMINKISIYLFLPCSSNEREEFGNDDRTDESHQRDTWTNENQTKITFSFAFFVNSQTLSRGAPQFFWSFQFIYYLISSSLRERNKDGRSQPSRAQWGTFHSRSNYTI